jgi:DNA-directed RNA polymerase specialized sigma24 family protein
MHHAASPRNRRRAASGRVPTRRAATAPASKRLLEERGGEDVASALGLTRGYVDVLLHRAKHSLRACLIEHDAAG